MPAMPHEAFLAFLNALQPSSVAPFPEVSPPAVSGLRGALGESLDAAIQQDVGPFPWSESPDDEVVAQLLQEQAPQQAQSQGRDWRNILLQSGAIIAGLDSPGVGAALQAELGRRMKERTLGRKESREEQMLGLKRQDLEQRRLAAVMKAEADAEDDRRNTAFKVAGVAARVGAPGTAQAAIAPYMEEGVAFDPEAIAARQAQEDQEAAERQMTPSFLAQGIIPPWLEPYLPPGFEEVWAAAMLSEAETEEGRNARAMASRALREALHAKSLAARGKDKKKGGALFGSRGGTSIEEDIETYR